MQVREICLLPFRLIGYLHKRACHPPGNLLETKITHFLSAVSALSVGAYIAYMHAFDLGLPLIVWASSGLVALLLTYLFVFPLIYLLLLRPVYRLIRRCC